MTGSYYVVLEQNNVPIVPDPSHPGSNLTYSLNKPKPTLSPLYIFPIALSST